MEISFTKEKNSTNIISCKRKDGTVTWMHSDSFFITHDLCHYAVESVLAFKKGFYGMLASGTDIKDFELPKDKRTFQLTDEAIFTEQVVNLLTIEYNQGRPENFFSILKDACSKDAIPLILPEIMQEDLDEIRYKFDTLMNQWHLLPEDQTMKLIFEE
jgi:hypothetical protein